ncbi:MAG: hypothetical protein LBS41_06005 [Streptococcaceae bacterium]|jgi:mannosyltransferase OCH1-like enzyme|nr:hypothetical protein [Streptococcaceae bacterium]
MIPKQIFYVWLGGKPIPEVYLQNVNHWQVLEPDYKVIRIDETNFDMIKYPIVKKLIEQKAYAFASDIVRLVTLYENGGVYLEHDLKLIKPIDDLLVNERVVFALEASGVVGNGGFFAAEQASPILKSLIDDLIQHYEDQTILTPIHGPRMLTEFLTKRGLSKRNQNQQLQEITILATEYFAPFHFWGGGCVTDKTYGIHQYSGSWTNSNNKCRRWARYVKRETLEIIRNFGLVSK